VRCFQLWRPGAGEPGGPSQPSDALVLMRFASTRLHETQDVLLKRLGLTSSRSGDSIVLVYERMRFGPPKSEDELLHPGELIEAERADENYASPRADSDTVSDELDLDARSLEDSAKVAANSQHSGSDGVGEDMATLALNPGLMGGSEADGPVVGTRSAELVQELQAVAASDKVPETGDAEVMLRLKAGELECFDYLMNKYRRPIVHFMFRMVHNQAIAEEMAQEVFLRVYRSRETYRAEARFTTWLYRIATNLAVNHARDTKNERTAPTIHLDEPDPETGSMHDVADSTPTIESDMLRRERMNAIKQHVLALPERQRMAVLMHKYQEMDYKQIGAVLKLSESATKSLLFRAYQTLRERLKEFV
jgi:RNA polymerase sigma-70 factor (ECF subfamily)